MAVALRRPTGMVAFSIVWVGQVVSLVGTEMTRFALALWAWQTTGSATVMSLVVFFEFGPTIILSPVAGALVDRWNRKLVMMLSDLAAGLGTVALLLLFLTDNLQVWHLFVAGAFTGAFQAFQWPAYSAAITTMVAKTQYARANGMLALAESSAMVVAPLLAGTLIGLIGIGGVMSIDVVTFVFAVGVLALIHVPQPAGSKEGQAGRGSLWRESLYGFDYIRRRPSLLGLQLVFLGMNFLSAFYLALMSPMILARTGEDAQVLGTVLASAGIGGVAGGLTMSTWGGPRRRVHGVLGGMALASLLGMLVVGLGRSLPVWAFGAFAGAFFVPILNGANQAIWQAKVAPDLQGRVFAARRLIGQLTLPVALLLAGPLADFVFEPSMQPGGALAGSAGRLIGTGSGAGMALLIALVGVLGIGVSLSGYLFRAVRAAETLLPDHDEEAET